MLFALEINQPLVRR